MLLERPRCLKARGPALVELGLGQRLNGSGAAQLRTMEWHMLKRLCPMCGVGPQSPQPGGARSLPLESDWRLVLLWRKKQRFHPPSK
jgi:hypothetical protein